MRTKSLKPALGLTIVGAALAFAATGCGTAANHATSPPVPQDVRLMLTTPASAVRTSADRIAVRGTVSPANAIVQIQGRPAAVGNGVFTGTATVHRGKTTVDVVASAPGATPTATSIAITRPAPRAQTKKAPAPSTRVVTPVVITAGATARNSACGDSLVAGPNTTCPFAEKVRAAYHGAGTLVAYSPVTHRTYVMTCSAGPAVACTGGNDASVYFPVAISAPTRSQTNCGPGLSAGPNTTCPFAERVRSAYEENVAGRVNAYSPVTHRTYVMTCVAGAPVVCTGGDHASVTIW
jgi:hypothetical protein